MRINSVGIACLAGLLCIGSATAAPPEVNFEVIASSSPLSNSQKEQLLARAKYWYDAISNAKDEASIPTAASSIIKDYRAVDSSPFRYAMAEAAARVAKDIIDKQEGQFKRQKETNIAWTISVMDAVPIRQALEKMVVSPNPAVRYLGWVGWRNIRDLSLASGPSSENISSMNKFLKDRTAAETSAPVLGAIFRMVQFPPTKPPIIPDTDYNKFAELSLKCLTDTWNARCRQILSSDADSASAAQQAMTALQSFAAMYKDNAEKKKAILQMIIDGAWCSGKAYDEAVIALGRAKDDMPAAASRDENAQLLRDCEAALNAITRQTRNFIGKPLSEPAKAAQGAAVRIGITSWVDSLKAEGVVDPSTRFPQEAAPSEESDSTGPTEFSEPS